MHALLLMAASLFAALGIAQDEAPVQANAAAVRSVQERLLATAALGRTAFTAEWLWPDASSSLMARQATRESTIADGTFHDEALWVRWTKRTPTELLQVGRHALLRSGDGAWRVAKLNGGALPPFVPDPQLLLRLLAASALQIGDRGIGERQGQAVELVAMTLTPEQCAELVFAGAMLDPNPLPSGLRQMMGQRGVPANAIPEPTVDVGIEFDVKTGQLLRLRIRALVAPTDTARIRQLAGGRAAGGAPPAEAATPQAPAAPLRYEDGMPVRASEGLEERVFELRLLDHGKAPELELDAQQRRLLGRGA